MTKMLGIDIGTTTISAVILDRKNKNLIHSETIPNDSFLKTPNTWERSQDPLKIKEKILGLLDRILSMYPEIASIGLDCQMHGILYVDESGRAKSPLYTWQDGRGNLPDENGMTLVDEIRTKTPYSPASGYGLTTHLYNLRHDLVPDNAVTFCTIGDYIGMSLTDRKSPLVHTSNAASFGFFDVKAKAFDENALALVFGTKAAAENNLDEQFSHAAEMSAHSYTRAKARFHLPEVTDEFPLLGLYRGIPVTVCIGDNQASFLGSAESSPGTVLVNMGTGGQISVCSEQYFEAPGIECRPLVPGKYLLVGSSLCGGRAYAVLEHFFELYEEAAGITCWESRYAVLERLALEGEKSREIDSQLKHHNDSVCQGRSEKTRAADGQLKVSTLLCGTRVHPELRGSISGISDVNFTPSGLVYGFLDGMADELYRMEQLIVEGTGLSITGLIGSGNGLRKNPVLQRITEEKFGLPLRLSDREEEAASGAALCGLLIKNDQ